MLDEPLAKKKLMAGDKWPSFRELKMRNGFGRDYNNFQNKKKTEKKLTH